MTNTTPLNSQGEKIHGKKIIPPSAAQHITAGPYSPVLNVDTNRLVVISGQAPLNQAGKVIGENIEEQTQHTLDNCLKQLKTAGVDFSNVFKVNVYLTNLDEWQRFNKIYEATMPKPLPARTAIGCDLLLGFKVEIEMWAHG